MSDRRHMMQPSRLSGRQELNYSHGIPAYSSQQQGLSQNYGRQFSSSSLTSAGALASLSVLMARRQQQENGLLGQPHTNEQPHTNGHQLPHGSPSATGAAQMMMSFSQNGYFPQSLQTEHQPHLGHNQHQHQHQHQHPHHQQQISMFESKRRRVGGDPMLNLRDMDLKFDAAMHSSKLSSSDDDGSDEDDDDEDAEHYTNQYVSSDESDSSSSSDRDSDDSDSVSQPREAPPPPPPPVKKRTRKRKPANGEPKRPISSYMIFASERRPFIKQEHPDAKFSDIGKLLGQAWNALEPHEKEKYDTLAAQDRERFRTQMDEYKRLHKDDPPPVPEVVPVPVKPPKTAESVKKPLSSYMYFAMEQRKKVVASNPNISFGDVGRKLGEEWKALSANDKTRYTKLAEIDRKRYKKELLEVGQTQKKSTKKAKKKKSSESSKKGKKSRTPSPTRRYEEQLGELDLKPPKKPVTSYFYFMMDRRTEVARANPDASFNDLGKIMGQLWHSLPEHHRAPYNNQAIADRARYQEQVKHYERQKRKQEKLLKKIKRRQEKKASRRSLQPLPHPQQPITTSMMEHGSVVDTLGQNTLLTDLLLDPTMTKVKRKKSSKKRKRRSDDRKKSSRDGKKRSKGKSKSKSKSKSKKQDSSMKHGSKQKKKLLPELDTIDPLDPNKQRHLAMRQPGGMPKHPLQMQPYPSHHYSHPQTQQQPQQQQHQHPMNFDPNLYPPVLNFNNPQAMPTPFL